MYYIYMVRNILNQKKYIGQTKQENPLNRWTQHISESGRINNPEYKNRKDYFHRAINKYGKENFVFKIIDTAETDKELDEKEKKWIYYYNSANRKYGYNLETGGKEKIISKNHLAEWKKNRTKIIKNAFKKKNIKEILSKKAIQRFKDRPELRENLSKMQKERIAKGLNKIVKRGKEHPFSKPILQISMKGKILNKFYGSFEAHRKTGIEKTCINKCCLNKEYQAGGYFWIFEKDLKEDTINNLKKAYENRYSYCSNVIEIYDKNKNKLLYTFKSQKECSVFFKITPSRLSKLFIENNGEFIRENYYVIRKNI